MSCHAGPNSVEDGLSLCLDFKNKRSFSPNTFPDSLDIYKWYTAIRGNNGGNNCTVAQDFSTSKSPAGGIPMRMDVTGNDAHIGSYNVSQWNVSTATTGQTWRVSVYAKASTALNDCQIFIFGCNSSGSASIPGGGWYGIASKALSVTPDWQRFDHYITFNNAEIAYIQMRLDGPDSNGAGTSVWWDGLQVEPVALTDFNPNHNQNYSKITNLVTNQSAATIFTYPTYSNSGSLNFDGSTDYADVSAGTLGSVITVEMIAKLNSYNMPFGFNGYDVFAASGELGFNTGASDRYGLTSEQTTLLGIFNNWKHFCFVMVNNTSASSNPYTNNKIYVNGISYPLTQTVGSQNPNVKSFGDGSLRLSGWMSSSSYKMPMDLSLFKIYNRQLTDEEITQNFNAVSKRIVL